MRREIKSVLKDFGKRMDSKIDRLVYFFLGGILLKGGFDFYMAKEAPKDAIKVKARRPELNSH